MAIQQQKAVAKSIELQCQITVDENLIYHDEQRLTQILLNLQSNAIKFTEKGQVMIKVSNDEEYLFISVIDTGAGISFENQDKLFKLFGFI